MPKYDYACPTCEAEFEIKRSFADADKPTHCPTMRPTRRTQAHALRLRQRRRNQQARTSAEGRAEGPRSRMSVLHEAGGEGGE